MPFHDPTKPHKRNFRLNYKPHCDKIKEFHLNWKKNFRFLAGGVGTGKTMAAVYELLSNMLDNPDYIGTKAIIVTLKLEHVETVIMPFIDIILQDEKGRGLRRGVDYRVTKKPYNVKFPINGSEIIFGSSEMGASSLASNNCSIGMLDEADKTSPDVFNEVWARLGRSKTRKQVDYPAARMICTLNPTAPTHWLAKRFFNHWIETGVYDEKQRNYVGGQMPQDTWLCCLSQYDNPYAKDKWAANELAYGYSENLKRRMLYGQFVSSEGTVFGEVFDQEKHCRNIQVNLNWECYRGLDFGATASGHTACLWVAYDRETGKHYIYREYYGKDKAPEENAKNIMSKTFTREHVITTYSDTYKESVLSYRNSGMSIIPAQKGAGSIEAGINQLRSLLYAGRIEIDKKCKGLITELESYAYNPNTGKPYDRDNNFIDALRYVLWAIEGKSHAITISKTTYKPTEDVSVDANLMYLGLGPDGKPLYARLT